MRFVGCRMHIGFENKKVRYNFISRRPHSWRRGGSLGCDAIARCPAGAVPLSQTKDIRRSSLLHQVDNCTLLPCCPLLPVFISAGPTAVLKSRNALLSGGLRTGNGILFFARLLRTEASNGGSGQCQRQRQACLR